MPLFSSVLLSLILTPPLLNLWQLILSAGKSIGLPSSALSLSFSLLSDLPPLRELECNVYSLGGLLRQQMDQQQQQTSAKAGTGYSSSILQEISRAESLLLMALRPICVYDVSDPTDERALVPHRVSFPPYPPLILQTLSNSYASRYKFFQQQQLQQRQLQQRQVEGQRQGEGEGQGQEMEKERAEMLSSLAHFTELASSVYAQYFHLKSRELSAETQTISLSSSFSETERGTGEDIETEIKRELYGFYKQMKEALETSLQFYREAGEALFQTNQFQRAQRAFEKILETSTSDLTVHPSPVPLSHSSVPVAHCVSLSCPLEQLGRGHEIDSYPLHRFLLVSPPFSCLSLMDS
jgi:hypothetical protein